MSGTTRVFVIEDLPGEREAYARYVDEIPGFECCGTGADNTEETRSAIIEAGPDILLCDIALHGGLSLSLMNANKEFSGLDLIRQVRKESGGAIRAIGMSIEPAYKRHVDGLADGFLMKPVPKEVLAAALEQLRDHGKAVRTADITGLIFDDEARSVRAKGRYNDGSGHTFSTKLASPLGPSDYLLLRYLAAQRQEGADALGYHAKTAKLVNQDQARWDDLMKQIGITAHHVSITRLAKNVHGINTAVRELFGDIETPNVISAPDKVGNAPHARAMYRYELVDTIRPEGIKLTSQR